MARNLRKYRAYDERTGRLERAIDLIEDGEIKGLKTTRREADSEHPQRRPLRVGPDRANLMPGFRKQQTYEDAQFKFVFGYTLGSDLWAQRTTPMFAWGSGGFTLTATIIDPDGFEFLLEDASSQLLLEDGTSYFEQEY